MDKYAVLDADAPRPEIINPLPELNYPPKLNVTKVLFDGATENGWTGNAAYFSQGQPISYAEVIAQTSRYAGALIEAGLEREDRVLIRLADTPELIFALLAVHALGAVVVPTFVQLRTDDLVYRLRDTGAKLAVVGEALIGEFAPAAAAAPDLRSVVVVDRDPTGTFLSLADILPRDPGDIPFADTEAHELTAINYTSGSTGSPKGACQSHRDMLAACDTYFKYCVKPEPTDIFAGPPSIPFSLGYGTFAIFPFRTGAAAVLEPDKTLDAIVSSISTYGVTVFVAVPTFYNQLLRRIRADRLSFPTLRMSLCGGEPLHEELENAWLAETGLPIHEFLGTTELFHCFLTTRHGEDRPKPGAIGRAVPGYEVVVRDPETFVPMPNGEQGILTVRGPTGTVYWNKPEQQRKAVRDGWSVFADAVWCDDEGYIHYVARHDDMIVSAGHNIAPSDVESVLMRHDAVVECACVAVPDPTGVRSSIVKAFVVARDGVDGDEALAADLQAFFRSSAPPYMYPREIEFMDSLPKTLTGKIVRSALRNRQQ